MESNYEIVKYDRNMLRTVVFYFYFLHNVSNVKLMLYCYTCSWYQPNIIVENQPMAAITDNDTSGQWLMQITSFTNPGQLF